MRFFELCEYLEKLEGTASRNEMTVILAEMYKEMNPEEAKLATYLVQGQLGPGFASPNMGIAEKQLIKAFGSEMEQMFKKAGDLGTAIEETKNDNEKSKKPEIKEVFEKLIEMAKVEGTGSQEIKQKLIRDLVEELDGRSAKYVIRIILSKLRTGFSDMTILDALSWMIVSDKSLRKEIEKMYNMRADLGEITEEIVRNKKPRNLGPELGTPVIMAKCERATKASEIWKRMGTPLRPTGFGGAGCAVEYKLDGLRIQCHITNSKIKLFSRGLEDMTAMFPDVVSGLKSQIKKNCIVEGEMIAVSGDGKTLAFNKTMNRKRKYDIDKMAEEIPMAIFLFDVLMVDNKSVIDKPNSERWETLENMITSPLTPLHNYGEGNVRGEVVRLMPRIIANNTEDIQRMFDKALKEGMEGIVAKRLNAPYTPGSRDFAWIKMKPVLDSVDVVVMGYSVGEGKRTDFGIGEFLVGVYDSKQDKYLTVSKVGSGATDEEWRRLKNELKKLEVNEKPESYIVTKQYEQDYWVRPSLVLEVAASEISVSPAHSSGYGLRFPRLISWREKIPSDATSVIEIAKLFKMQKVGDSDGS